MAIGMKLDCDESRLICLPVSLWRRLRWFARLQYVVLVVICCVLFITQTMISSRHARQAFRSHQNADKGLKSEGAEDNEAIIKWLLTRYDIPCDPDAMSVTEAWDLAASWVTPRSIHPDYAPELGCILHHMSTAKIIKADLGVKGSQNKLLLTLEGGQEVAFKAKWVPRDYVVTGKPFAGRDRHNGEIVSFSLNRLLGYNRTPLAAGRIVSMEHDIINVATPALAQHISMINDSLCYGGECTHCSPICAEGDTLEGALILWLPKGWKLRRNSSPWMQSYSYTKSWEGDDEAYCDKVKKKSTYRKGPLLMDLMDAIVMDYLTGNADRHHYETFKGHNDSMLVMLDNGKSFGNPYSDEATILLGLLQCCRLRQRTWERVQVLSQPGVLSRVLQQLTRHDPLDPLLTSPHYRALERRLRHVKAVIGRCTEHTPLDTILVDDVYSKDDYGRNNTVL